jgi:hypothetical protein
MIANSYGMVQVIESRCADMRSGGAVQEWDWLPLSSYCWLPSQICDCKELHGE